MTFELCNRLKTLGVSQKPDKDLGSLYYREDGRVQSYILSVPDDAVKIPNLSELIKECGDDFGSVSQGQLLFFASTWTGKIETSGETPEEAVGELVFAIRQP